MVEDVGNPTYWAKRLEDAQARGRLHEALFLCSPERWRRIEEKHRQILAERIPENSWVLDVGCGYGRLINVLPLCFYYGVDLSPELVALGQSLHRSFRLRTMDVRQPLFYGDKMFDWAVMVSFRPMIIRNQGEEVWGQIEANVRKVAKRLLYLEYDEHDEGSVE